MPVLQLSNRQFLGEYGIPDLDAERLKKMQALKGEGPYTSEMFTPQVSDENKEGVYLVGEGPNSERIENGYRLLKDFLDKSELVAQRKLSMHPSVLEEKLVMLRQETLEIASIQAIELFMQSTIVKDIQEMQSQSLEEKVRVSDEETDQLEMNMSRAMQIHGYSFDPWSAFVDGGTLWLSLQEAKDALAKARDAATSGMEQDRLANEMKMIPSILKRYNSVSLLTEWYSTVANKHQRRALQMMGHELIPAPKYNNPEDAKWRSYRKFLHQLEFDYDNSTDVDPAVLEAMEKVNVAADDCEAAFKLIKRMRSILSRPTLGVTAGGILSSKLGADLDILIWVTDNVKRPNPMVWDQAVRPWEWLVRNNVSMSMKMQMRDKIKVDPEITIGQESVVQMVDGEEEPAA